MCFSCSPTLVLTNTICREVGRDTAVFPSLLTGYRLRSLGERRRHLRCVTTRPQLLARIVVNVAIYPPSPPYRRLLVSLFLIRVSPGPVVHVQLAAARKFQSFLFQVLETGLAGARVSYQVLETGLAGPGTLVSNTQLLTVHETGKEVIEY